MLEGWQPEQHPRLLQLLDVVTHELAAGQDRPGPDLDGAWPADRLTARRPRRTGQARPCTLTSYTLAWKVPAGSAGSLVNQTST